jgi:hypothetical protein
MKEVKEVKTKTLFEKFGYKLYKQVRIINDNPFFDSKQALKHMLGTTVETSYIVEYKKKVGSKKRTTTKTIYFSRKTWEEGKLIITNKHNRFLGLPKLL